MFQPGKITDKLGVISFINTLPVYYPAQQDHLFDDLDFELVYAPPSGLNQMMLEKKLAVSPVSSAFYLRHQDQFVLLEDLSVSSPGAVESVLFLSNRPIQEVLNPQKHSQNPAIISVPDASETSVSLLAYLLWRASGESVPLEILPHQHFQWYPAAHALETLHKNGAVLVIGDEALSLVANGIPEGYFCYDLAQQWHDESNLPFVFAVWIAQKDWAEHHPERLQLLNKGLINSRKRFFLEDSLLQEAIQIASSRCRISPEQLRHYFTSALSYTLPSAGIESLNKFKEIIERLDTPRCDNRSLVSQHPATTTHSAYENNDERTHAASASH
ncbi:MAG: menaquinone biosynthesis protein [Cyanobacteria bacterium]|nr:menaquinone biosynthesis protein [Cyanobacteriota bacterium]